MVMSLIGGVLGAMGAAKDRKNIAEMNRKNNEFYEFKLPYMKENIDRVEVDYIYM